MLNYLKSESIGGFSRKDIFEKNQRKIINVGLAATITTSGGTRATDNFVKEKNGKIRKLTPKETFRLMGVKDVDYENIAKNQSNTSLYHLAGDSIVTTIIIALFGKMLNVNWKEKIELFKKEE